MLSDSPYFQAHPIYYTLGFTFAIFTYFLALLSLLRAFKILDVKQSKPVLLLPTIVIAIAAVAIIAAYVGEIVYAAYWGAQFELEAFKLRLSGPFWYAYVITLTPYFMALLFFMPKFRYNLIYLLFFCILNILVCSGLLERALIIYSLSSQS